MTNTIEGLRVYQFGAEAVKAQGTLTVDTQPTAGDEFVIGSQTYTFVASGASNAGEINIGADVAEAKVNIVAAINGTDGWNSAHPLVSAAAFAVDDCVITARVGGDDGDDIVFTETFTAGTNVMDGAGTLGGTTAGSFARGTPVAATSKIAIERLEWGDDDENLYRPQIANGLLLRNRGAAVAVQHGTRFSFGDQPVVFEQLPHWLSMAVRGDVQPTLEAGSPNVYRWSFTRLPTANPNPMTWTLERRFSDGNGNVIDQRASYGLLSQLSFSYAQNEHLRMSGEGFARKFNSNTLTAALSLPAPVLGVSALSTVYMDDAWADVGDTVLSEQVLGWEFEIGTGFMPLHTAEGRTDLDFTKHQVNALEVTLGLRLTLLLDPTTYAAEAAHAAAGDRRAVRINVASSGGRRMYIDALMQYAKPSLFNIGEQDGQDIVEIELEEATDNTNFFQIVVDHPTVNSLD